MRTSIEIESIARSCVSRLEVAVGRDNDNWVGQSLRDQHQPQLGAQQPSRRTPLAAMSSPRRNIRARLNPYGTRRCAHLCVSRAMVHVASNKSGDCDHDVVVRGAWSPLGSAATGSMPGSKNTCMRFGASDLQPMAHISLKNSPPSAGSLLCLRFIAIVL
jgi:hypothetical protein